MRLRESEHDQLQESNWRHYVIGPQLPFFHKRKGALKMDKSLKMPRICFSRELQANLAISNEAVKTIVA